MTECYYCKRQTSETRELPYGGEVPVCTQDKCFCAFWADCYKDLDQTLIELDQRTKGILDRFSSEYPATWKALGKQGFSNVVSSWIVNAYLQGAKDHKDRKLPA